jgi:hypothetical protein
LLDAAAPNQQVHPSTDVVPSDMALSNADSEKAQAAETMTAGEDM